MKNEIFKTMVRAMQPDDENDLKMIEVQLENIISKLIHKDVNPKLFFHKVLFEKYGVTNGQEAITKTLSIRGE
jgi:hypothetical protein